MAGLFFSKKKCAKAKARSLKRAPKLCPLAGEEYVRQRQDHQRGADEMEPPTCPVAVFSQVVGIEIAERSKLSGHRSVLDLAVSTFRTDDLTRHTWCRRIVTRSAV